MVENVELDAALIHAALTGGDDKFMFAARNLGLKPSEAVKRSHQLAKASHEYQDKVVAAVEKLQAKRATKRPARPRGKQAMHTRSALLIERVREL